MTREEHKKEVEKELARQVKRIASFNKHLEDLYQKYGTQELYLDNSSTHISAPEIITPLEITFQSNEMLKVQHRQGNSMYDWTIAIEYYEDGDIGLEGCYEFEEDLKYYRKCIKSAERFYQSEDPDKILESDGNEDE